MVSTAGSDMVFSSLGLTLPPVIVLPVPVKMTMIIYEVLIAGKPRGSGT